MTARPRTILVVEDDQDIREAMLETLTDEGFSAAGAEDGEAALRWLADHEDKPAVILLDLMMPRMDGTEFRSRQLRDVRLSDIPVVVVSADGNVEAKSMALRSVACLKKPIHLSDLLSVAQRFAAA